MHRIRSTLVWLLVTLAIAPGVPSLAAGNEPGSDAAVEAPRLLDPVTLEAWLDGLMAAHLESHDIAGATVSVVEGGEVVLAKGYGFADIDAGVPVDAERTLFRVGSISKIFTWTAIMQLVEQGKLDLDADVNQYLDFEIVNTYPEPITLNHLLTHTPGFEDRVFGLFGRSADQMRPLGAWLAANQPARVRPPGIISSYSNYGTALAGYIVERISGAPFDDYIERQILEPLGLRHTTTRQPLPAALAPDMSVGYSFENGGFVAHDFEFLPGATPAGSVSASATDMARFMLAHLGHGSFEGARILGDETSRRMQTTLFQHDPRLNGFAHGFFEMSSHGEHIIGHGGDTIWFHSLMALFPERDLGVFVSYNSARGGELSLSRFLQAFLDRHFPIADAEAAPARDATDLARYVGTYRMNRMSYTTFEKVLGLFVAIRVSLTDGGEIVVSSPLGIDRYVEVEPLVFEAVDGSERAIFRADDEGRITHLFVNSIPMMAFVKLAWWQSPVLHQAILGLGAVVSLGLTLLGILRLARAFRRRSTSVDLPKAWLARLLLSLAGTFNTLFFVGLAVTMGDQEAVIFSSSLTGLAVLLAFPLLAALLLIPVGLFTLFAWREGFWTLTGRLRYTAAAVVLALFAWSLNYWNLLGWRLG